MNPIWRDIEGYEGFYQVSSIGQVRSVDRVVDHKRHGKVIRKGRVLKELKNGNGYSFVTLYKNGKYKPFKVHRLVATAFGYNPHDKNQVNHESGIKTENGIWNLEFVTPSENIRHAYQMGLFTSRKTLTDDQADQVRYEYASGDIIQSKLAEKYGVSIATINNALNRKGRYVI